MVFVLIPVAMIGIVLMMLFIHLVEERHREAMWRAYQQGKTGKPLR